METNLFAIGDVHGNIRALEDLLCKILQEISDGDTLAFLGDYIEPPRTVATPAFSTDSI